MRRVALLPLVLISLGLIVGIARAETFTVPALREYYVSLGLSNGDRVSGSMTVVGGSGNDVDFYVTDPNGNRILSLARMTQTGFSFSASTTGPYTMYFDNTFSNSSKSVTLDYTVTKSILGLPQEHFLVLLGLVVVLIAVVVVVTLRKTNEMKTSS